MSDDPVDFEAAKDRRVLAEIDADQAEWEGTRDRLVAVMKTSELFYTGLISATLRALIEVLVKAEGLSLDDAKDRIATTLRVFHQGRRF